MINGVQYLVSDRGTATAVVVDLKKHGGFWEVFFDLALAESRRMPAAMKVLPQIPDPSGFESSTAPRTQSH